MELHKAIEEIVACNGSDMICNPQIINCLMDYQAFKEKTAAKLIFKTIIASGYANKILAMMENISGSETKLIQFQHEFVELYGFKEDIVQYVFESIVYGLTSKNVSIDAIDYSKISNNRTSTMGRERDGKMHPVNKAVIVPSEFSEDYIVSLYPAFFHEYRNLLNTRIHIFDIKQTLHLNNSEVARLTDYLLRLGVLIKETADCYDICDNCSVEMLRKLYCEFNKKRRKDNYKRFIEMLSNIHSYRMLVIKLLNGRSIYDSLSTIPIVIKDNLVSKFVNSGILDNEGKLKNRINYDRGSIGDIFSIVFKNASDSELEEFC